MRASNACVQLVKQFEGCRLEPYTCPAGIPTVGYGATYYPDGRKVQLTDACVSPEYAASLLLLTLKPFEQAVEQYTKVALNQNQFDAMVCFAYNVGIGAWRGSTLLKRVNEGKFFQAALEFDKWVFAKGKRLEGLVKRRAAERALFETPCTGESA